MQSFNLNKCIEILSTTPSVLNSMLLNIGQEWHHCNEGNETWSPFDILGHLIHGEKTDWMVRLKIIISDEADNKCFEPFDRFAQLKESKGKTLYNLLDEFKELRKNNLSELKSIPNLSNYINSTGIHPAFGSVTLKELIATWAVHDLNHIAQIARVLAKQLGAETGPWKAYLKIIQN